MIEQIMSETLLGKLDRETALCRISCVTAASHRIYCKCGVVLDAKTTVVVTLKTAIRRGAFIYCYKCWNEYGRELISVAKDTDTSIMVESWNGILFSCGEIE